MTDKPRWVRQWRVPSESNPSKHYTVSLDKAGSYHCHCWPFLRNRSDCKHILAVKNGEVDAVGEDANPEPAIEYCKVQQVTPVIERGVVVKVKTPLIPFGNTHFQATVLYDLLAAGVRWETVRKRYDLAKQNSRADVEEYVRQRGRLIYGPHQEEVGFVGYQVIPLNGQDS